MSTSQQPSHPSSNDTLMTLGTFLRARRERLTPIESQLRTRRRTPGLRREEVAMRASISAEWYTYLEQDRGIRPSTEVLERIAIALELDWAEREYMNALAFPRTQAFTPASELPEGLQLFIDDLEHRPAYVVNDFWDIVGWNTAAANVFPLQTLQLNDQQPNLVKAVFLCDPWRQLYESWELTARRMLSLFRLFVADHSSHPRCTQLVTELLTSSADFAMWWKQQDVAVSSSGTKHLIHPQMGELLLNYTSFRTMDEPSLTVISYSPHDAMTRQRLQTLHQ
jgi:transcriptional regulator with XRE-family HTH domain